MLQAGLTIVYCITLPEQNPYDKAVSLLLPRLWIDDRPVSRKHRIEEKVKVSPHTFNHIHETGFGGSVPKAAEWDGERLFILSCQGCLSGVSRSSRSDVLNEKESEGGEKKI